MCVSVHHNTWQPTLASFLVLAQSGQWGPEAAVTVGAQSLVAGVGVGCASEEDERPVVAYRLATPKPAAL